MCYFNLINDGSLIEFRGHNVKCSPSRCIVPQGPEYGIPATPPRQESRVKIIRTKVTGQSLLQEDRGIMHGKRKLRHIAPIATGVSIDILLDGLKAPLVGQSRQTLIPG